MAEWKAKRFWKVSEVVEAADGFLIHLDGRTVKTPAKADLRLPGRALAEAIAAEWDAQEDVVDPHRMPLTRMANSAIDKVAPQFADVAGILAAYAETDLICYRAEGPALLVAQQAEAWDPLLAWVASLGAPLVVTEGVIPVAQPEASLAALSDRIFQMDAFELAGFHDLVAISGSIVIGLAAMEGRAEAERLWTLSRVDEAYQSEVWGEDEEAAEVAALKRQAFLEAARFIELLRS